MRQQRVYRVIFIHVYFLTHCNFYSYSYLLLLKKRCASPLVSTAAAVDRKIAVHWFGVFQWSDVLFNIIYILDVLILIINKNYKLERAAFSLLFVSKL